MIPSRAQLGVPERVGLYQIGEEIGSGSTSMVCEAVNLKTAEACCVKIIPKALIQDETDRKHFASEIEIMKSMDHPNIVKLFDLEETDAAYMLFMEKCQGKCLLTMINEMGGIPEPEAIKIISQLVAALRCLHSRNIAHRDLKPENVLVDSNGTVKLIDFGLSSTEGRNLLTTFCGSIHYAAPECLSRQPYVGTAADMWSLGVVIYAVVTGSLPWNQSNIPLVMKSIEKGDYTIPLGTPPRCANLITQLLVLNPDRRPTADEVAQHPWLCNGERRMKKAIVLKELQMSSAEVRSPPPLLIGPNKRLKRYMSSDGVTLNDSAAPLPPLYDSPRYVTASFKDSKVGCLRQRSCTMGMKPNVVIQKQKQLPLHKAGSILAEFN